ncbi:MAG: Shedu anti-phage system protein SduA domain-containing protein, partial [Dolichospermum sp.]
LTQNTALIEIKTPKTQLLGSEYRSGDYGISSEISGAVSQLLRNRDSLIKNYHSLVNSDDKSFDVFNPRCILIAGNSNSELSNSDKKRSFELQRYNFQGVEIVTYDEVFEKVHTLVNLLEGKNVNNIR